MPKYTCERCLKVFSQKSHYDKHQNKKIQCQNNKEKIEEIVENIIINKKLISNNTENIITTIVEPTEPSMINQNPNESLYKNKIFNMDCLKYLEELSNQEKQIDTIILDPPYFNVVNEKWDTQWKSIEEY